MRLGLTLATHGGPSPATNAAIDSMLADHRKAIEQLVDVSSDIMQHRAAAELLRQRRRTR
jgi:hypothetical protein